MKSLLPFHVVLGLTMATLPLHAQSIGSRHTYSANYVTKLDAQNRVLGYSFQTPDAPFEVGKAAIVVGEASEPGQVVKVGFQEAVPNGNDLVPSGSYIDDATQEVTLSAPGVKVVEFQKPVSLPAQTPVFLMVESVGEGAPVSITHYAAQRAAEDDGSAANNSNQLSIFDASQTPQAAFGMFAESPGGTTRQWRRQAPIFALLATDGTPWGLPKMAEGVGIGSDSTTLAQEIEIPSDAEPFSATDLQLYVRSILQEGAETMLKVQIEDASDNRVLGEQTLPLMGPDQSGQISGTPYMLSFKPAVRFEPGKKYRLLLQTSGLEKPNRVQFSTAGINKAFTDVLPELEKLTATNISKGLSQSSDGGKTFEPYKEPAHNIYYVLISGTE